MKMKISAMLACAIAALPLASFGQADTDAAAIAVASLRSQKAQCETVKEAPARAKCMDAVATLALRLLEAAPKTRAPAAAKPAVEDPWGPLVSQGMAYLTRAFKDPSGVRYRNLVLSGGQADPMTLCGEVNGRNSYGAYVGFRRFFVMLPQVTSEIEERGSDVINRVWGDFCETRKRADVEVGQAGEISVRRVPDSAAAAAQASSSDALPSGCPAAAPGCSWARSAPAPAPAPAAPAEPAAGISADGCPATAPGCSWGKRQR